MHIVYVTETWPPELNGVALTVQRTVDFLRARGHAVQVVRPRQPGEAHRCDDQEWRTAGWPIPLYPALRFGWAGVTAMRRRLGAPSATGPGFGRQAPNPAALGAPARPDLVHVATPGPLGWAALRAARAEHIPATADFRTHFQAYSRHYKLGWIEPLVWRGLCHLHAMADATFVPTRALAGELGARGLPRLRVCGRGVDAERFNPRARDPWLRRRWRARAHHRVLLHVGRLAPEKNVAWALEAWERLRTAHEGLRMVVVGDGPLRAALQQRHPDAIFTGALTGPDLARHYASADVFLFPSLTDTFGNVVLEALASGLSIAAFDTGAAGQFIRDGIHGSLARPQEGAAGCVAFIDAARRALDHAAPDGALRQWARIAARRADWNEVLAGFERELQQVAGTLPQPVDRHAALA